MTAQIPTIEPSSFTAGDTAKWTKSLPDYLPADGWVLKYTLVMLGAQKVVTATNNGDGRHLVTIAAADSANYPLGMYAWQAVVERSGERYTVATGRVEVKPNFIQQTSGHDARSHVKKVLDALEAMLEGKASRDQMSYSIMGRTVQRMSPEEIIKWHSHYKGLYASELVQERVNNGQGGGRFIKVRF